jgi:hypothetical protein
LHAFFYFFRLRMLLLLVVPVQVLQFLHVGVCFKVKVVYKMGPPFVVFQVWNDDSMVTMPMPVVQQLLLRLSRVWAVDLTGRRPRR